MIWEVISARTQRLGQDWGEHSWNFPLSAMFDATASTDRLIELILDEDKDVLKEI